MNVLPRTPATERMFDADAFAAMKPTATFVNIGRGATVDEAALIEALRSGSIGAALDVFDVEPLPPTVPWTMPNVLVSPHAPATTRTGRATWSRCSPTTCGDTRRRAAAQRRRRVLGVRARRSLVGLGASTRRGPVGAPRRGEGRRPHRAIQLERTPERRLRFVSPTGADQLLGLPCPRERLVRGRPDPLEDLRRAGEVVRDEAPGSADPVAPDVLAAEREELLGVRPRAGPSRPRRSTRPSDRGLGPIEPRARRCRPTPRRHGPRAGARPGRRCTGTTPAGPSLADRSRRAFDVRGRAADVASGLADPRPGGSVLRLEVVGGPRFHPRDLGIRDRERLVPATDEHQLERHLRAVPDDRALHPEPVCVLQVALVHLEGPAEVADE